MPFGIESKALHEVLLMGWLEEVEEEEPELTDEQIERQDHVDNAIHALLVDLAERDVEWDISLIGAVRDRINDEFSERGIM